MATGCGPSSSNGFDMDISHQTVVSSATPQQDDRLTKTLLCCSSIAAGKNDLQQGHEDSRWINHPSSVICSIESFCGPEPSLLFSFEATLASSAASSQMLLPMSAALQGNTYEAIQRHGDLFHKRNGHHYFNAAGSHSYALQCHGFNDSKQNPCANYVRNAIYNSSCCARPKKLRKRCDHLTIDTSPVRLQLQKGKVKVQHHDNPGDHFLHQACLRSAVTLMEIEQLLIRDTEAASRSLTVMALKPCFDPSTGRIETKLVKQPYTYPLHLAIANRTGEPVVQSLMMSAPQILSVRDGAMRETPLCILLKHSPTVSLVSAMLLLDPSCVLWRDRHDNTVVHVACTWGVSADVLKHLCMAYPEALHCTNFHGKKPLEIAQERTANKWSEEMCTFIVKWLAVDKTGGNPH